jgi:hypothetical protein
MMTEIYRIGMLAGPLGITHAKHRALQMNFVGDASSKLNYRVVPKT